MRVWKTAVINEGQVNGLAQQTGLPVPAVKALLLRGIATPDAVERFLKPRLSDLSDPYMLHGMPCAVERVWRAIDAGERIVVYGDFDVDGVTSTALLVRILRRLGGTASPFIPQRVAEGYGLTAAGLERCLTSRDPQLLITVDCGITAISAAAQARGSGVSLIITDHHEPASELPVADAVVNPKLGSDSSTRVLAGVGVVFKLCHALIKYGREKDKPSVAGIDLREYMDLVSLGTVADIVPLTGENRILVRHGLPRIRTTRLPGLRALMTVSGIGDGEIDTHHIGFALGPRLNAAGRMGSAEHALDLLLGDDDVVADRLAGELDLANKDRKRVEDGIVTQAQEDVAGYFDPALHWGIVVAREGWHIGTIGIVATRLCSRFARPAVVIGMDGAQRGRGSCRSIEGLSIVDVLQECSDCLESFGGHKMAAGLEIQAGQIDRFRERFNAACAARLKGTDLRQSHRVDAWLTLGEADQRLMAAVNEMRPFGDGNPSPVWGVTGVVPVGKPRIVGKNHLKLTVAAGGSQMDAIAWGMGDQSVPEGPIDVLFHLEENEYMGRRSLQMKVKDFRASETGR